mmetsp:Transcript_7109/g.18228  ORF Transcript_7109/g.18228 Transcript_7109/m.18228 type:complete len:277 (-) Transcript_7109:842-1672(-)
MSRAVGRRGGVMRAVPVESPPSVSGPESSCSSFTDRGRPSARSTTWKPPAVPLRAASEIERSSAFSCCRHSVNFRLRCSTVICPRSRPSRSYTIANWVGRVSMKLITSDRGSVTGMRGVFVMRLVPRSGHPSRLSSATVRRKTSVGPGYFPGSAAARVWPFWNCSRYSRSRSIMRWTSWSLLSALSASFASATPLRMFESRFCKLTCSVLPADFDEGRLSEVPRAGGLRLSVDAAEAGVSRVGSPLAIAKLMSRRARLSSVTSSSTSWLRDAIPMS